MEVAPTDVDLLRPRRSPPPARGLGLPDGRAVAAHEVVEVSVGGPMARRAHHTPEDTVLLPVRVRLRPAETAGAIHRRGLGLGWKGTRSGFPNTREPRHDWGVTTLPNPTRSTTLRLSPPHLSAQTERRTKFVGTSQTRAPTLCSIVSLRHKLLSLCKSLYTGPRYRNSTHVPSRVRARGTTGPDDVWVRHTTSDKIDGRTGRTLT